jgi:DNA helicase-2/ATP-dependent DNA helicase PcrA
MTIHSAKGLEFPIVILPGFEDGIFPGMQNIVGSEEDMEEERRLAYVAITRAKEQVYILHTKSRLLYGQTQYNPLSRFVKEIPDEYIIEDDRTESSVFSQFVKPGKTYIFDNPTYPSGPRSSSATQQRSNTGYNSYSRPTQGVARQSTSNAAVGGGYTGAKPAAQQSNVKKEVFAPGDRVRHMTFGDGEVLSVRSMGADILYEVMFETAGTKKLMATYAKLKKI